MIFGVNPYYNNEFNCTAGLHFNRRIKRIARAVWWMHDCESKKYSLKISYLRNGAVKNRFTLRQIQVKDIDQMWKRAGNRVQWKPPKAVQPQDRKALKRIG